MAYFAKLDSDNIVLQVIVIEGEGVEGVEGEAHCADLYGGNWKQTSDTGSFRKNYAGKGYTYDAERDAFIGPKPFDSWVLTEETCIWTPPIPFPMTYEYVTKLDGSQNDRYIWDEETLSWIGPLVYSGVDRNAFFNEETGKWEVK